MKRLMKSASHFEDLYTQKAYRQLVRPIVQLLKKMLWFLSIDSFDELAV